MRCETTWSHLKCTAGHWTLIPDWQVSTLPWMSPVTCRCFKLPLAAVMMNLIRLRAFVQHWESPVHLADLLVWFFFFYFCSSSKTWRSLRSLKLGHGKLQWQCSATNGQNDGQWRFRCFAWCHKLLASNRHHLRNLLCLFSVKKKWLHAWGKT